jgi:(2R)-sulfolactate sulfo-lyase subunit alpha
LAIGAPTIAVLRLPPQPAVRIRTFEPGQGGQSMIHFVVHDEHDSVGVVVVEGVKAGQQLKGWIMDQDKEIKVSAQSDIPIGHKLAIQKLKANDTVIKYGTDIGRTIAPIKVGEHAHVHNIKTKRW